MTRTSRAGRGAVLAALAIALAAVTAEAGSPEAARGADREAVDSTVAAPPVATTTDSSRGRDAERGARLDLALGGIVGDERAEETVPAPQRDVLDPRSSGPTPMPRHQVVLIAAIAVVTLFWIIFSGIFH